VQLGVKGFDDLPHLSASEPAPHQERHESPLPHHRRQPRELFRPLLRQRAHGEGWVNAAELATGTNMVPADLAPGTTPTQLAAYQEMVNAMAGICDEVANGKLDEPFAAKDPSLEESPFAQNSIIDFTDNIKGVQDVYLGKYSVDGKGLEDIVRQYNLQLDSDIKLKMDNAINSLGKITDPFGKAITTQAMQIETAMSSINDLKEILETQLLPFVQQHTK